MNPTQGLMGQLTASMAQGGSPMNIQTPGSPGYQPGLAAPTPPAMPDQSIASQFSPAQMQQSAGQQPQQGGNMVTLPVEDQDMQAPGLQVPQSEAELIIKALTHRSKSISKIQELAASHMFPQPQQPAQASA